MVTIKMKGVVKVRAKGHTYFYAWRGGPRLRGEPGSPEFIASHHDALETLRQPDKDSFRSLVVLYKGSDPYQKHLAASTKRQWEPWLDRIADHFGDLRIAQFNRPEKIGRVIRQWRSGYAD